MKFSYFWLQDFIRQKLPRPKRLAELLILHSFEVKTVEKFGKDWVFDIAVPANRSDCFSHRGIAREIGAITNYALQKIASYPQRPKHKLETKNFIKVEIKDKTACSRYTALIITDIKVGSSPAWMQERLRACGLQPINNVVDAANYVMLETGQPLHAFDFDKISYARNPKSKIKDRNKNQDLKNVIVRRAKKGETMVTLDGRGLELDEDILIIADPKDPLAIAGIKGGKKAEIDEKTKNVVLEAANFNPFVIRRGSRKLCLKTDASLRFEHGLDPNLTESSIYRTAELISELAGGKVASSFVDFYPQKVGPKRIKVENADSERTLEVKMSPKQIKTLLGRLEITTQNWTARNFVAVVPSFRLDIVSQEDVIEEIARLYGYEKIPERFPHSILIPPKRNEDIFWANTARDVLKGLGFTEVYTYSFISDEDAKVFGDSYWIHICELENPVSSQYKYLRPSLLINLLKVARFNQKNFSEIRIFELGKVFGADGNERRMLTGLLMDLADSRLQKSAEVRVADNFYFAKGAVDSLFSAMGVSGIWYDEYKPLPDETPAFWWREGRSSEIKTEDDKRVGYLGEVDPKILRMLDIKEGVVIFDIDFEKLQMLATEEQIYRPISKYPAAIRDISILVPQFTKVEDVLNVIEVAGGELVRDVDLFDIYEGEDEVSEGGERSWPENKKSMAFHIVYQAKDRTLTAEEIERIHNKIIKALEKDAEWEVRK